MEGVLYDKGTQEPLLDGEGNKVTSSVTFTPTAAGRVCRNPLYL
mgnify:CR=1 FL=1